MKHVKHLVYWQLITSGTAREGRTCEPAGAAATLIPLYEGIISATFILSEIFDIMFMIN